MEENSTYHKGEKLKKLNPLSTIVVTTLVLIVFSVISIIFFNFEDTLVLNIIEIIVLPLSLGFTALAILQSKDAQVKAIELERIKMTNEFISGFRSIMDRLSTHSFIKQEYYKKNDKLNSIMNSINTSGRLNFSDNALDKHFDDSFDYDTLNKYVSVTKDEKNKNLDSFVNVCQSISYIDSYSTSVRFHEVSSTYNEVVENINKKYYEEIEKIKASKSKVREKSNEATIKRNKNLKNAKLIYARSIRNEDTEVLNDMECLLFNVNFDLLNYEQLYHLVINPFKSYINNFYFDIFFSHVNGLKRNELIYSNIIEFYEIMLQEEKLYKSDANKSQVEIDKILKKTRNRHKKPV